VAAGSGAHSGRLRGAIAWWLWGIVHVLFLVGSRNRVAVVLNWIWSYAFFAMAAGLVSSRPLLMSNCAPDRLRRLSVDADKCPSHVFRVTEPDRLRDAFDGFDSRLYPASG
jgi:hypothetical protein